MADQRLGIAANLSDYPERIKAGVLRIRRELSGSLEDPRAVDVSETGANGTTKV